MFAEEDGAAGAADHAVRQRAKVRRKEIEQEEQKEAAEEMEQQRSSQGKAGKEKDRIPCRLGRVAVFGDVEFSSPGREEAPSKKTVRVALPKHSRKRIRIGGDRPGGV